MKASTANFASSLNIGVSAGRKSLKHCKGDHMVASTLLALSLDACGRDNEDGVGAECRRPDTMIPLAVDGR